jgi:putative DNA methylase
MIETEAFPFEFISALAERESWRKEIHRPIYHIHKWWANRLGSVFRGILLGCVLPETEDLRKAFYQEHDFRGFSVLDPFMGSGTTVGEAHKLGLTAIGRDINPVACESVRIALGPLDPRKLQQAFSHLSSTVGNRIRALYQSADEKGRSCDVLYFFWVKNVPCPECGTGVDLFSTRIIARNAYPARKSRVQLCCPYCGGIFPADYGDTTARCPACGSGFDLHVGPAAGAKATCASCSRSFQIVEVVRALGKPPAHRLYAKLLLTPEGKKKYLPATREDLMAYAECSVLLKSELEKGAIRLPDVALSDGFNTRQSITYNYRNWRDFFNDRQLLALGWLQDAIAHWPDATSREVLLTLFSGVLEFNNVFASYKGEGTGAVRHMFSHHILKPERTPIEANVWGTSKSSGSFTNLFKSRLMRAVDYRKSPFEVVVEDGGEVRCASAPFSGAVNQWPANGRFQSRAIYLSCGSSEETGLPDSSVDLVVTDPPFFDNVHYSELADFFYAWQRLYPRGFINGELSTRNIREVQDADPIQFARKLRAVFAECHRVLKDVGLLVFSYHHSRAEGWSSLLEAVIGAGFSVTKAHPVKSEMSVAAPKSQAKEPIQLDVILVCRKREMDGRPLRDPEGAFELAARESKAKCMRLSSVGLRLSANDCRIVAISQFISELGPQNSAEAAVCALNEYGKRLDSLVPDLRPEVGAPDGGALNTDPRRQMILPF